MQSGARELVIRSWYSVANLSMFLLLLIIVGFVLPSVGFERNNLPLYSDCVFSLVLVFGAAIAWATETCLC